MAPLLDCFTPDDGLLTPLDREGSRLSPGVCPKYLLPADLDKADVRPAEGLDRPLMFLAAEGRECGIGCRHRGEPCLEPGAPCCGLQKGGVGLSLDGAINEL